MSWTVSTSPNAEMANSMLRRGITVEEFADEIDRYIRWDKRSFLQRLHDF